MAPGSNTLPFHGNEKTMNLNPLVLANIQASPYFKLQLYELKTYHQVIDEIYYKVNHLEPWEKGSRKVAGQTGMCGGVRGVGTGGIVSSAFCLLYKLYTLKLTHRQVVGLCTHTDSPFIRALGLMYIRFTVPPEKLWSMFEPYLDDEEEVDPKAGGGNGTTIGLMAEEMLVKLEWYGTLFPRIPVPPQKEIERKLKEHKLRKANAWPTAQNRGPPENAVSESREDNSRPIPAKTSPERNGLWPNIRSRSRSNMKSRSRSRSKEKRRDIPARSTYNAHDSRRSRDPSIDRFKEKAFDLNSNRSHDKGRDRSIERAPDRSVNRVFDRAMDRAHDRSMDRAPDRSGNRVGERGNDRVRDRSMDRSNNRSRDRSRDEYREPERKIERKRDRSVSKDGKKARSHDKKKHKKKHKHERREDYSKDLQKELERVKKN